MVKKNLKVSFISLVVTIWFSCGKLPDPPTRPTFPAFPTTPTIPTIPTTPTSPAGDSLHGLIAHWSLDSATSAKDITGNQHHGTIFNTTFTTDRFGNKKGAFYFNGQNSYISVEDQYDLRLNNTDFTLNAWVKMDAYNASLNSNILCKHSNDHNDGYVFALLGNGNPKANGILSFGPGRDDINAYGAAIITLGGWHMVTCVYRLTKKEIIFYVDGVPDKTTTGILSPNARTARTLYIGRDDEYTPTNGYFFQGALDDIRIYKRALTIEDIQELLKS